MPMESVAYSLALRNRFRGITERHGLLVRGAVGWAEWSPFPEYTRPEIDAWWQATVEAAEIGFPAPVRDTVPVSYVRLPHGQGEGGRAGAILR
jgi:O-succinylbenzoate synthase